MAVIIIAALLAAPSAYGDAKRGQFPDCQEVCLSQHTEKMREVVDTFKMRRNKLQYQDAVERLGREYEACLDNCREPYPVK